MVVNAKIIMRATFEVQIEGAWDDKCQLSQVKQQGGRQGSQKLMKLHDPDNGIAIIGQPEITRVVLL